MNRQRVFSIKFIIGIISILVVYYIIANNIGLGYEKLYILPLLFIYNILGADYKRILGGGYLFQKRYIFIPL